MARIPRKVEADATLRPVTGERFRATDQTAGLRAIGEGAQQLGRTLGYVAEEQDRMDAALDNAGAKTLDTEAMGRLSAIRTGFLSQRGLNAGTARADAEKAVTDAQAEIMAKATTPRMKKMLEGVLGGRVQSTLNDFAGHVQTQMSAAEDDASVARSKASAETAIGAVTPEERKRNVDTGLAEIEALGRRRGADPAVTELEKLEYRSGVNTAIITNRIDGDDVDGALDYLRENGDDLTANDRRRVSAMLRDPLQDRQAEADLVDALAGALPTPTADPENPTPSRGMGAVPFAQVKARIMGGEVTPALGGYNAIAYNTGGGGNAAGVQPPKPVTQMTVGEIVEWQGDVRNPAAGTMRAATRGRRGKGDKGSTGVGAYQFERDTLRQNAEQAFGKGWRDVTFTPANQDRVAETLWNTVRDKPRLLANTWAAFGGGAPRGQASVENGNQFSQVDGWLKQQVADGRMSPERAERARMRANQQIRASEGVRAQVEQDAARSANDVIDKLPGNRLTSMSQLPASVRASLSSVDRMRLEGQVAENTKPKPIEANGAAVVNLHQLAVLDPEGFKQRDLRSDRATMTPGEYDSLATLQAKMIAKRDSPDEVAHSRIWSTISRFAPDVGLDLGSSKGKPNNEQDRKDSMRLFSMMQFYLNGITGGERQPTDDEIKRAFDNAVMPTTKTNEGWLWNSTEQTRRFRTEVDPANVGVPAAQGNAIRAKLRARGLPYDDGSVARFYRQYGGR